jgi:motility quorum-sensing regulator/GCU-specific mRNA interferase toxin
LILEKRKPPYDLSTVQSAVRLRGADAFTATALIGAQAMGLEVDCDPVQGEMR